MSDDDNSGPSVKVDISAKVEAKFDVPADVSRDTLAFFQRLLGPVAEAADFLGDKVRFYRWKSAMKVIARARQISAETGIEPNPVPIKFLVPFLEKCSLEEETSELGEYWAHLLAKAATFPEAKNSLYVHILAEISAGEARLLSQMAERRSNREVFHSDNLDLSLYFRDLENVLDRYCAEADQDGFIKFVKNEIFGWVFFEEDIANFNELILDGMPEYMMLLNLRRLGLSDFHTRKYRPGEEGVFLIAAEISPLGYDFVRSCQSEE